MPRKRSDAEIRDIRETWQKWQHAQQHLKRIDPDRKTLQDLSEVFEIDRRYMERILYGNIRPDAGGPIAGTAKPSEVGVKKDHEQLVLGVIEAMPAEWVAQDVEEQLIIQRTPLTFKEVSAAHKRLVWKKAIVSLGERTNPYGGRKVTHYERAK